MRTTSSNRLSQLFPAALAEVDTLVDHFLAPSMVRATSWRAPATLREADDKLHVEIDAPGVKLEDVEITFEKGQLKIALERRAPEGDRKVWYNERGYGKITRSLTLPDMTDPDTIEASLVEGVLHVSVGKFPEVQPKRIEVKGS